MKSSLGAFVCSLAFAVLLVSTQANASTPQFSGLSQSDVDSINREFGANSSWHSVTTPSSLGSVFGFELGVVGGLTTTPDINTLANRAQAGTDVSQLPHGGLLGGFGIPGGLTFEALFIPKINTSGVDFQQYGAAVKWTLTDQVIPAPVNIALRGFISKSQLSYTQNVTDAQSGQSVPSQVTQSGQMLGLQALLSPKFIPVLEPYIGFGILSGKGSLSADVTNNSLLASGVSGDTNGSSTQLLAGLEVKLLVIAIGAEYERAYEKNSYTAKFSFKF